MDCIEKHSVNDILEIEQIKKILKTKQQKDLFNWMIQIVNKELNGNTTKNPVELVFEETSSEEELDLSDHESDED
tara:strand:+ start:431 stop:655 length:225 start_codon:yes stop_codon:yes gene_type:complete